MRNWILQGWRASSLRNGFVEYDGPIFEHLQLFTVKSGEEIVEQLFHLTDRGGRELAIRPEITPTLARMVNAKINALSRPIKWFSMPRLCRAERPQKGRLREFFQWNIDIIGEDSVLADAECIYTAVDYLRSVGLTSDDVVVKYSSRSLLAEILKAQGFGPEQLDTVYTLLDRRAKLPEEKWLAMAEERLPDARQREQLFQVQGIVSVEQLRTFCAGWGEALAAELAQLEALVGHLERMEIGRYCEFDIRIVRGLAYYTGPVFEVFDRQAQLRALCGGGRYDNLLAALGGPKVSATGFGMGDVVLEILLRERGLLRESEGALDFFVIDAKVELFESRVLSMVSQLRGKGFSAAFSYKRQSLSKQLKQASASRARYAVIVGEETDRYDQVTLKNLSTGTQASASLPDFLANPREAFSGGSPGS